MLLIHGVLDWLAPSRAQTDNTTALIAIDWPDCRHVACITGRKTWVTRVETKGPYGAKTGFKRFWKVYRHVNVVLFPLTNFMVRHVPDVAC